ncbi:hypothetical protein NEDG_00075 [Nematocida displodere]|uniref:Uncharacterized protein n=1 Tax=Nematocida displodere TaxID=1805483 RepID=A0A177EJP4_9MICR|nr:hypothetical protein NEDG_00075 [Nematocida displodere]
MMNEEHERLNSDLGTDNAPETPILTPIAPEEHTKTVVEVPRTETVEVPRTETVEVPRTETVDETSDQNQDEASDELQIPHHTEELIADLALVETSNNLLNLEQEWLDATITTRTAKQHTILRYDDFLIQNHSLSDLLISQILSKFLQRKPMSHHILQAIEDALPPLAQSQEAITTVQTAYTELTRTATTFAALVEKQRTQELTAQEKNDLVVCRAALMAMTSQEYLDHAATRIGAIQALFEEMDRIIIALGAQLTLLPSHIGGIKVTERRKIGLMGAFWMLLCFFTTFITQPFWVGVFNQFTSGRAEYSNYVFGLVILPGSLLGIATVLGTYYKMVFDMTLTHTIYKTQRNHVPYMNNTLWTAIGAAGVFFGLFVLPALQTVILRYLPTSIALFVMASEYVFGWVFVGALAYYTFIVEWNVVSAFLRRSEHIAPNSRIAHYAKLGLCGVALGLLLFVAWDAARHFKQILAPTTLSPTPITVMA